MWNIVSIKIEFCPVSFYKKDDVFIEKWKPITCCFKECGNYFPSDIL
jgi:hypothetical protein